MKFHTHTNCASESAVHGWDNNRLLCRLRFHYWWGTLEKRGGREVSYSEVDMVAKNYVFNVRKLVPFCLQREREREREWAICRECQSSNWLCTTKCTTVSLHMFVCGRLIVMVSFRYFFPHISVGLNSELTFNVTPPQSDEDYEKVCKGYLMMAAT